MKYILGALFILMLSMAPALAGTLTSQFSLTITGSTSSACGAAPPGQAATDAAAAGFTTCALYNDFTTAIPNSVGTGLPSNWLDCSQSGGYTPNAPWTFGMNWINYNGQQNFPCSVVSQATDPTGSLALEIYATQDQINAASGNNAWISIQTSQYTQIDPGTPPENNPSTIADWNFPLGALYEFKYWDASQNDGDGEVGNGGGFWGFGASAYGSCAAVNYIEFDFIEGESNTGIAWAMGQHGSCGSTQEPEQYWSGNLAQYNVFDYLLSNDGNNNLSTCLYVDGTFISCSSVTLVDNQGQVYSRWSPTFISGDNCSPNCGGYSKYWIQYFKVYSCSTWDTPGNPAASACSGSSFNGNFWVP